MKKKAIVTGAAGFIGSHLCNFLKEKNYWVRGIDIEPPTLNQLNVDEFLVADLSKAGEVAKTFCPVDELYLFAADMGGVGHINTVHASLIYNNVLINTHSLEAARNLSIKKIFFPSSVCVYPEFKQDTVTSLPLKESDAVPAQPDTTYGWEKLFSEQMCIAYEKDYGIQMRIGRIHNIYGPGNVFEGGKEKSPAALCYKVAVAKEGSSIEIWGDGKQVRSYCYIDDCCEGIYLLMQSPYNQPLNIGSDEDVTVEELANCIISISGKRLQKKYDISKPQGVRGRNSDNTLVKQILDWEPTTSLKDGLEKTYVWIEDQIKMASLG